MNKIGITNPMALKSALKIAIEVSFADLTKYQTDNIQSFINQLPNTAEQTYVPISTDDKIDLVSCIRYFYQSYTYRWIRGDLSNALNDLEFQITNKTTPIRIIRDIG